MPRKSILIVSTGFTLVGMLVVGFWVGDREPKYNGTKLSEWLRIAVTNLSTQEMHIINDRQSLDGVTNVSRQGLEAARAVRAIGTNALPFLVRWTLRPPAWRLKLTQFYGQFPGFLRSRTVALWLYGPVDNFGLAFTGFQIMGPDEALAVPELVKIIRQSRSFSEKNDAILCLGFMKERARAALPVLQEIASSKRVDAIGSHLARMAWEAMVEIRPGSGEKGGNE